MKNIFFINFVLVLIGGWSGGAQTITNTVTQTNLPQTALIVKSGWKDTKVVLYRSAGGMVQLDAKEEVITQYSGLYNGHFLYTNDFVVNAFINPKTGNAWLGFGFVPHTSVVHSVVQPRSDFYLETKSGIVCGSVSFFDSALSAIPAGLHDVINGRIIAAGRIQWFDSVVPNVKRSENVGVVIDQFNKNGGLRWVFKAMGHGQATIIQDGLRNVENGLNPWLFVNNPNGSRFTETTIEAIDVKDENLRLDLKGPDGVHKSGSSGVHTASVWIDLKTWKVVKAIQDNKP